jgi:predicted phosphate transport protein (TIGR00153 family)
MSRKNEYNYFEQFVKLSKFSLDCAEALNKTLHEFDKNTFEKKVKEMHEIEHEADLAKHEVLNRLIKEFLPPIEREDINSLSQKIDDVTDAVEDVVIKIDMFNVQAIPQDILKFSNLIVKCCTAMNEALVEFQNFKKSTTLTKKIIEINTLEEEGDALYYNTVRNLFQTSKDPVELLVWTQILHRFELCYDCCEDVANLIETVIMKNS